jgi:hypothetical protein
MSYVYEVWCEWDIGQDYQVFDCKELAVAWAREALKNQGINASYESIYKEGLIGTSTRKRYNDE